MNASGQAWSAGRLLCRRLQTVAVVLEMCSGLRVGCCESVVELLDGLPLAALAAVRQVAEELTIRESVIFLDGREFTGEPPGCAPSSEAR